MMLVERDASDLSDEDSNFLRLSTMDFLTRVDLIPVRVAMELVTPLEASMALQSAVSTSFLRSIF